VRVSKYHGLGNDFVLIEDMEDRLTLSSPLVAALCDRRLGVGADGVIRIAPGVRAAFSMDYWNADGSPEAMCGNGIRCVGKYVYDRGLTDRLQIPVDTQAGVKHLALEVMDGVVARVRVDMGRPRLERGAIPMRGPAGERFVGEPFDVEGTTFGATAVSMGNPHLVLIGEDALTGTDVCRVGPRLEHHPDFPERTNIEFVTVVDGTLRVRVWERGSGETTACGTGACASLVAAHLAGAVPRRAPVRFLGGQLEVEWTRHDRVMLTGPATFVFDADVEMSPMIGGSIVTPGPRDEGLRRRPAEAARSSDPRFAGLSTLLAARPLPYRRLRRQQEVGQ
jgi:diaminopimelate epimerase